MASILRFSIRSIFQALEQVVLVTSKLDAQLLELLARHHAVFGVVLVLGVGEVLCTQSGMTKFAKSHFKVECIQNLPVIMPVSSVLKVSFAEATVGVNEPGARQ